MLKLSQAGSLSTPSCKHRNIDCLQHSLPPSSGLRLSAQRHHRSSGMKRAVDDGASGMGLRQEPATGTVPVHHGPQRTGGALEPLISIPENCSLPALSGTGPVPPLQHDRQISMRNAATMANLPSDSGGPTQEKPLQQRK